MTEPIYEYVKGQGWVVQGPAPILWQGKVTWNNRTWELTVLRRAPSEGEHGWNCVGYANGTSKIDWESIEFPITPVISPWFFGVGAAEVVHWGWPCFLYDRPEVLSTPELFITILQKEITGE